MRTALFKKGELQKSVCTACAKKPRVGTQSLSYGLSVLDMHLARYSDKIVKHPKCFVAGDETRINHATPGNKIIQTSENPPPPFSKESQRDATSKHNAMIIIMATVFRDHKTALVVDFIYCVATVTAQITVLRLRRHGTPFDANGLGCCAKASSL